MLIKLRLRRGNLNEGTYTWHGTLWSNQGGIDLYRDRALQQRDGHDQFMISFKLGQNAHHATERSRFNSDFLSYADEWPRLSGGARRDQCPHGTDFLIVHRSRNVVKTYDLQEPRRFKNRQPVIGIKSAEEVSRKERQFDLLDAIRPPLPAGVQWQKQLVTFGAELIRYVVFAF